jgi:fanconi-associated nuclease 1
MALFSKGTATHNKMLGRRVSPQVSSSHYEDDALPPGKRRRAVERTDSEEWSSLERSDNESPPVSLNAYREEIPDSQDDEDSDVDTYQHTRLSEQMPTELESALAPVKTDKEAITEYELMRAAGEPIPTDLKERLYTRKWAQGKSSIYVDAFNLALETVLEDESNLFDESETEVFNQWKALDYETQYLLVLLRFS